MSYKTRYALLFLAVPFLLFTLFRNLPIVIAFIVSLLDWDITGKPVFVGFRHYIALLGDDNFRRAFLNTVYYVAGTVPLSIVLGLLFAALIEARFIRGKAFFRTVYFLPVVCSMVAIATVWSWIYNPMFGLLNQLTARIGLGRHNWVADPYLALPCIMAMSVWKTIGYNMIIYIAGLKAIPSTYYEAASIDGASKTRSFLAITIPLLRPVTLFLVIMGVINSFQVFDQVFILSQGQLQDSTNVLVFYLYHKGFNELSLGYASAIGYYIFLVILGITLVQFWLNRRHE
ncbi:MAG: sugar ABC transporter permease [bacterium]|nr:sugar ABC transporter permease [Candidatus Sumerlaeota bacterium]